MAITFLDEEEDIVAAAKPPKVKGGVTFLDEEEPTSPVAERPKITFLDEEPEAKPPVGTSFIEELAAIPQAIKQSIDQPLEAMGETAEVLGASGLGSALRGAVEGPEGYVPAAQRFMDPQEGEFQVAGFAPQFLPRAIVEQAGQLGGAILTRVGGAAVGGLAGSALGPKGTAAGAVAGAFIGPALFEMGQIVGPVARERAANQGREEPTTDDLAWAWATAGASGALNAVGAKYIPGGDKLTGSLAKRISTAIAGEGSTEGTQALVQQTGESFLTEQGLDIKPKEIVGEAIIGGGTGGAAVAATAPFTKAAAAAETKVVAEGVAPIAPETAQAVSEQANRVMQEAQAEETAETPEQRVARLQREAQEGVDIELEEEVPVSGLPPVEPTPAAGVAGTTASVPVMITRKMEADLLSRGLTQEQINAMTPQEANDILAQPVPTPEAPVTPAVAPVEPTTAPLKVGDSFNYNGSRGGEAGSRVITDVTTLDDGRNLLSFGDRDESGALLFVDPRYSEAQVEAETRQPAKQEQVSSSEQEIQLTNIDTIVEQGGGTVAVQEGDRSVKFKQLGVVIDGDEAQVAFVELDPSEQGRAIGLRTYRALGNELASREITLRSSGALYGAGNNLWEKLLQEGSARRFGGGYEFVATPAQPVTPTQVTPTPVTPEVTTAVEPPALAPLRRVAQAEQTEEDVSGLVGQGLVELYKGQPVITQAGLETLPEAERPRLNPEARKIQIDTRTSDAAAEAISKNLRIGVDQVPFDVRMPEGWTIEGDIYIPPVVEVAPEAAPEAAPEEPKVDPINVFKGNVRDAGFKYLTYSDLRKEGRAQDWEKEGGVTIDGSYYPTAVIGETKVAFTTSGLYVFKNQVRELYESDVDANGNTIFTIQRIVTPEDKRGQGNASKALSQITDAADKAGLTLQLQPAVISTLAGRGGELSAKQLVDWYKRNGFTQKFEGSDAVLIRSPKLTAPAIPEVVPPRQPDAEPQAAADQEIQSIVEKYQTSEPTARMILANINFEANEAGVIPNGWAVETIDGRKTALSPVFQKTRRDIQVAIRKFTALERGALSARLFREGWINEDQSKEYLRNAIQRSSQERVTAAEAEANERFDALVERVVGENRANISSVVGEVSKPTIDLEAEEQARAEKPSVSPSEVLDPNEIEFMSARQALKKLAESNVISFDDSGASGKARWRYTGKMVKPQYVRLQEAASVLAKTNLRGLDAERINISGAGGRANRAYTGNIFIPRTEGSDRSVAYLEPWVLLHEVGHTLTSDAFQKYVPDKGLTGADYYKQLKDALKNKTVPRQVKRAITLYIDTIKALGFEKEYFKKDGLASNDGDRGIRNAKARTANKLINPFTGSEISTDDMYALADMHEFYAQAWNSESFQDILKQIKVEPQKSAFQKFVDIIKDILGFESDTMAYAVIDTSLRLASLESPTDSGATVEDRIETQKEFRAVKELPRTKMSWMNFGSGKYGGGRVKMSRNKFVKLGYDMAHFTITKGSKGLFGGGGNQWSVRVFIEEFYSKGKKANQLLPQTEIFVRTFDSKATAEEFAERLSSDVNGMVNEKYGSLKKGAPQPPTRGKPAPRPRFAPPAPQPEARESRRATAPQQDRDYLDAVERGDLDAAQRMVDEAARVAGYNRKLFHGTNKKFTSFSKDKINVNENKSNPLSGGRGLYGDGFYFTPDKKQAGFYGKRVMEVFVKIKNPLVLADDSALNNSRAKGSWTGKITQEFKDYLASKGVSIDDAWDKIVTGWREASSQLGKEYARRLEARRAEVYGFDAIFAAQDKFNKSEFDEVVVFDPNQIKSADPVTYDSSGAPIPLSQRFQQGEADIRYNPLGYDITNVVEDIKAGRTDGPLRAVNNVVKEATAFRDRVKAEADRRQRPRARGKAAILERIARERSSGKLSEETAQALTDFVNSIREEAIGDTAISIKGAGAASNFDFGQSLVSFFLTQDQPKVGARVGIHEFWHGLSRFLPKTEAEKMAKDYTQALSGYLKDNPWFLAFVGRYSLTPEQFEEYKLFNPKEAETKLVPVQDSQGNIVKYQIKYDAENYRYIMLDEWIAEKMTDLVESRQAMPNTFMGKLAKIIKEFLAQIQAKLGRDVYQSFYNLVTDPNQKIDLQRMSGVARPFQIYQPQDYNYAEDISDQIRYAQMRGRPLISPEENARFMELAKDPETNREELQKMVDDAAEKAGLSVFDWWHGTKKDFNTFKATRYDDGLIFFSSKRDFSEQWAKNRKPNEKILERIESVKKEARKLVDGLFAADPRFDIKKPWSENTPEMNEAANKYLEAGKEFERSKLDGMTWIEAEREMGTRIIRAYLSAERIFDPSKDWREVLPAILKRLGIKSEAEIEKQSMDMLLKGNYLIWEDKNLTDAVFEKFDAMMIQEDSDGPMNTIAVRDPSLIKMADPVTRDDQGNVIPLDQRFQSTTPDIRYNPLGLDPEPTPSFAIDTPEAKTLSNLKASMEKVDSASETKGGKPETQKVSEIAADWMESGGDERALQDAITENTNLSPANAAKVARVIAKQYDLQQQIAETGAVIAEIAPEEEGAPRKSSVTKLIEQTTGVRKPVVKLQVSESAALKKQIQLKAREARETRKSRKEAAEDLAKSITDYVKANPIRGPINSRQAMSITKKALRLDVNNEAAVDRFEMYVEKVIENANYDRDLADARALIKRAKTFAKAKGTQGNVKTTLDAIASISPTLLDNPFEFNLVVQRYLLGLAPVTAKKYAVMPDADVRRYLESLETQIKDNQEVLDRSKAQRILDKQAAYAEEKGIPLDEAISILNSEEFLNEKTIEKLEDLTKLLTSMAQESQKDVKAYDETGATLKQKELISFMGKVNLESLTNEQKKQYIRSANNLLANGATFGMEQFQSIALGQESAVKALKDKRLSNKLAAWISPIGGDKAIDTARKIALRTQSEADTFKNIFGREAVGAFRNILGLNRLDVAQTASNTAKENIANEFGEFFRGLRKKYGNDATGFEAKGYAGIAGYLIQTDGNKTEAESIPYRRRLMEQNIAELRKSDRQSDQTEADLKERALAQLTGTTNSEILSQLQALNPASYEQLMWVKDVMLPKWRDFLKEHDENFRNQANNYNNPDHLTITYKFPEGQLLPNEIEDVYQQDMAGMRIKQAANSIKRKDHQNLPVSKAGTVANIDINFGYNQYNALVDQVDKAYVAPAWEQVVAFTKTPEFEQVMGGRANALFVKKLLVDIQTSRTRQSMTDDESQMVAGGVRLARKISTQAVLGGFTQPLRQVPDQLAKLFFTTGRFDLIKKNLLKIAEAAPLLNKFPIGRRGDAQAGTQYSSQFSELARKVEASVTDRKWAQYRELMNRVGEFWMTPLRGSDVWAAKVSWMSYYEAELNKKGIKMESWEREAELVDTDQDRKEAASYAEFAVDFYGGASDPTKMASLSKQTNNGWKEFAKLMFLPLNSFALQQKNSLISDLRDAYLRTGDRKASIAAAAGTLAGMAAFHGMRIYIIGGLLYPAGKALLMGIFGIDMDEPDEEEKQKKLEDNWRKFKSSMYGNIVAGGAGQFVEQSAIDAVNKATYMIQANVNPDELLNDDGEVMSFRQYEKDVSPLYRFRSFGTSEYSFGLADVLTEQAQRSLTETQQIMSPEEMERYTGNEQAYAMFSTMVEWLYFFRLMDTDATRIARDLKRQMDKQVEEREKEIKAIRGR